MMKLAIGPHLLYTLHKNGVTHCHCLVTLLLPKMQPLGHTARAHLLLMQRVSTTICPRLLILVVLRKQPSAIKVLNMNVPMMPVVCVRGKSHRFMVPVPAIFTSGTPRCL